MAITMAGRTMVFAFLAAGAGAALACGGRGDSSALAITGPPSGVSACLGSTLLTQSPIVPSAILEIAPLGNLNPPGHVFPSDHIYFYQAGGGRAAVVAPGSITIAQVGQQTQVTGGQTSTDYIVKFFACADVMFYFYHVVLLAPDLLADVGSFAGACNPSYVIGTSTYTQCYKDVNIKRTAGAAIGTLGATGALDFGAYDRRVPTLAYVNASRTLGGSGEFGANHTVCPIDYFPAAVAGTLGALFGGRGALRTVAPVCGAVMQDQAGTAQGRWYFDATESEGPHLALVHDNVNPGVGAFSVGASIPTLPVGVYTFTPVATGRMNADFSRVTADGNVYCYQVTGPSVPHIYVKLTDASTLMIGAAAGASCGDPAAWSASLAATQFTR